ncbi:MAG TPA: S41 family peptidase [Longimicrobium sp.]|nr:S41 family peptidase [Longimicrobium sp.]
MIRSLLTRAALVLAASALLAPATIRAQAQLPDTPAGRRAAALIQTATTGDSAAVRRFVMEQMTPEFQQMPMEQHQQQFARMKGDFAGAPVLAVRETDPNALEVTIGSARGPLRLVLEVEPTPPNRIAGIRLGRADGPAGGGGGGGEAPPATLTEAQRGAVVDSVASLFERIYLLRDSAQVIAAKLRQRKAAGAYATLTEPAAFAAALTADIRSVNDDKHLRVVPGPLRPPGPQQSPSAAGGAGAYRFLDRVEMLPGDVGYVKLGGMAGDPAAMEEFGRAMRELEHSKAMVLDLRGNRGGSGQMSNAVISHFTAPGLLTLTRFNVREGDTIPRRTLQQVPGPRRVDVPLFVLVDSMTVSAGEDAAFVLHNLGRATLIGETTRGGGRNNQFFSAGNGFMVSISIAKVWDPCTGKEWERTGIAPDVRVPSAQALDAALQAARTPERYRPPATLPQRECRVAAAAG